MSRLRIGLLGPDGTHTAEAGVNYCQERKSPLYVKWYDSIDGCFVGVENGHVAKAVVPILNSTRNASWVNETLKGLRDMDVKICDEYIASIRHHLAAFPGASLDNIKYVHSKDKAYRQCQKTVKRLCPDAQFRGASSTAAAAEELCISEAQDLAVIVTESAAQLYNLQILEEDIQDDPLNKTRFIVLSKQEHPPTGDDKTTLLFEFKEVEKPALLGTVLEEFSKRKVSLTYIQSIPKDGQLDNFTFYCELFGHLKDENIDGAITALEKNRDMDFFKVLGSYPR